VSAKSSDDGLAAVGALQEPLRRALYRFVVGSRREVSRNEAAEAVGVQRTLAAFHLDKLVDAGLLEASFRRLTERRGPGAGRPAKLYRRADVDLEVSLPPRSYGVAAELLAEAVEDSGADAALQVAARRSGHARGEALRRALSGRESTARPDIAAMLTQLGFEPFQDGEVIRMQNCPFHQLSRQFPPLICGMNLALLQGLLEGAGLTGAEVRMDPAPGRCCVAVTEAPARSKTNRC
jgi:predicted ArsR family transcriptional regulator